MSRREGLLVLSDGAVFTGELIGADPEGVVTTGEVVLNTVLSGFQEVLSDPGYAGQIIAFTYPHIGNCGVNEDDDESSRPACRGVIVRELARRRSNWRGTDDLEAYLVRHGLTGISGVDTRRLTRHIRDAGAMPGALGDADETTLRQAAASAPGTDGRDLVAEVTCDQPYRVAATVPGSERHIVAYDFGIKRSILRRLALIGDVTVVPAPTSAAEVLALDPDGVFLSNGPGDPAALDDAVDAIREFLGEVPTFGIGLGHQLLARASGGETTKLRFGHHGGNHPVQRVATGQVEITSHNHSYAVVDGSLGPDVTVSHVNLNDGVIEGLRAERLRAFGVQYHPGAGTEDGHDAGYLFDEFAELIDATRTPPRAETTADGAVPGLNTPEGR